MRRTQNSLRALVDANLLVSVLVSPNPKQSAAAVLVEADRETFTLVVPREAMEEAARVARSKPWLMAHILPHEIELLLRNINTVAETPRRLENPPPRICRDPGDDYLVAHAILARVDFLVTRDRDLLDLGEAGAVRIVDPVAFLVLLREMQDTSDAV